MNYCLIDDTTGVFGLRINCAHHLSRHQVPGVYQLHLGAPHHAGVGVVQLSGSHCSRSQPDAALAYRQTDAASAVF